MKILILVFSYIFLTNSGSSFAATILNQPSCEKWVHDRNVLKFRQSEQDSEIKKKNRLQIIDYLKDINEMEKNVAWLYGWMSAFLVVTSQDILNVADVDSYYLWIDNYCAKKPLEDLGPASIELLKVLVDQNSEK